MNLNALVAAMPEWLVIVSAVLAILLSIPVVVLAFLGLDTVCVRWLGFRSTFDFGHSSAGGYFWLFWLMWLVFMVTIS